MAARTRNLKLNTYAGSGAIALRSVNYPDHYITEGDTALLLTTVTPDEAAHFLVRPPA